MIRSKDDEEVLKGQGYSHSERLSAVWAYAHDLAVEQHGEEKMPEYFTSTKGNALMAQLEGAPDDATCDDMVAIVKAQPGMNMLHDPAFAELVFTSIIEPDMTVLSVFCTDTNCREFAAVPIPWFPEHSHA